MIKKLLMLILVLLLCGCQSATNVPDEEIVSKNPEVHTITIKNINGNDISFTYDELLEFPSETVTATRVSSSGEVVTSEIKGVPIDYFLNQYQLSQKDVNSIYLLSSDGYSVMVPNEFLQISPLMIVYEENGEMLDVDRQLVKSALVDQRALYWVKFISEIELILDGDVANITSVMLIDDSLFEVIDYD